MRTLNYYGDGRRDTLLSLLAAMRAARKGKLEVQFGPMDEQQLSAFGLWVTGSPDEMERFETLMAAEVKRLKIRVEPGEYLGENT